MKKALTIVLVHAWLIGACSDRVDYTQPVTKTTALVQFDSCAALEADLKKMLLAELQTSIEQARNDPWMGEAELVNDASDSQSADEGLQEGVDFSGTNNQEQGVDEADFVKTDGHSIYMLNGNRLHIFGVPQFGMLVPHSETKIEGYPRQMLIHREAKRVVIFSQIPTYSLPVEHPLRKWIGNESGEYGWHYRVSDLTKITVLDISDLNAPVLQKELYLEGYYQTARLVDSSIRLGAYSWMHVPGLNPWSYRYVDNAFELSRAKRQAIATIDDLELSDLIPQVIERATDGSFTSHSLSNQDCESVYRPLNSHGRGVTSILSLDLMADTFSFDSDQIISNSATFYSSKDNLYIAEPANAWWWFWWNEDHPEQLNIHKFDIKTPGETKYLGSGRVTGVLHNQFSLGEHNDDLRVATTENRWGRWWLENPPQSSNHVWVLRLQGNKLETIGHIGDIAGGERIFSARFIGERGYLVTFRNIDPLFTIDIQDPTDPKIMGELKVPGFSTYIHPIADDRLLTIGVGGDDTGANWRTQISLFDVSDFDQPSLFDTQELVNEGEWGWSEAQYEHKAFQYWAPKGLLAIPMSSYGRTMSNEWNYRSRLELISVDVQSGLSLYGHIDHSHLFNSEPGRYWTYRDIRRTIFMGDFIYAISDRGISVHRTQDLVQVAIEQLPGYCPEEHYWWW